MDIPLYKNALPGILIIDPHSIPGVIGPCTLEPYPQEDEEIKCEDEHDPDK